MRVCVPFAEQVQVEVGQHAAVAVRIVDARAIAPPPYVTREAVVGNAVESGDAGFEDAGRMSPLHRHRGRAVAQDW